MKKAAWVFLSAVVLAMFGAGAQEARSGNLVRNGDFSGVEDAKDVRRWRANYCFVHADYATVPADSPVRQDVRKAVAWEIKDGMAVVRKSPDLVGYCKGDKKVASNVSGGFCQFIPLVKTEGGNYVFSLRYRIEDPAVTEVKGWILIEKYEKPEDKDLVNIVSQGKMEVYSLAVGGGDWRTLRKEFAVPAGINWLTVVVRIDGVGELRFKDVSLTEKE